ncbi:hypothetical protein ACI8AG_20145 [Blastococcus sp. SYSU DS0552]
MTDEQLAAVRCYTSAEVVRRLNMKEKWLKDLVRERRVPHQRTGPTKGVWFTAADVLKIGEMLPDLRLIAGTARPAPGQGSRTAACLQCRPRRSRRPRSWRSGRA